MTAIWGSGTDGTWRTLEPAAYQAEAELHDLVENAPQMLPLAGSPQLTVLGREVRLGNGFADLIAVESTGRLVIIKVKLAPTLARRSGHPRLCSSTPLGSGPRDGRVPLKLS